MFYHQSSVYSPRIKPLTQEQIFLDMQNIKRNMSLERFRKVYALLPESEKKLTIIVIGEQKITWEQAHEEITKNSPLGNGIQQKLEKLEII